MRSCKAPEVQIYGVVMLYSTAGLADTAVRLLAVIGHVNGGARVNGRADTPLASEDEEGDQPVGWAGWAFVGQKLACALSLLFEFLAYFFPGAKCPKNAQKTVKGL